MIVTTAGAIQHLPSAHFARNRAVLNRLNKWKARYPKVLQAESHRAEVRDIYHYELLSKPGAHVVDLGGGFASHNLLLGMDGQPVTVVDMFSAYWSDAKDIDANQLMQLFEEANVNLIEADLPAWSPAGHIAPGTVDTLFSAHCFEHFHQSPMPLLRRCMPLLRPGGRLVVCVPNAVNLRKRIDVARGRSNMPPWDSFFLHQGPWFGHVREYCVNDLQRMAQELGLTEVEIFGRNWLGMARFEGRGPRAAMGIVDRMLRTRPGLCSDLYLIAKVAGG